MTGAYMRVRRDGKFQPVEVEHMTHSERVEQFMGRSDGELLRWIDLLCVKLVEAEKLLDGLVKDGILERPE